MSELSEGERLQTLSGAATVQSISRVPGEYTVFSLEIDYEHPYYVSDGDVLVHNACPDGVLPSDEDGIDLTLKYRDVWTAAQRAAADAKVAALNDDGNLIVSEVDRAGTAATSLLEEAGVTVGPGQDVDHIKDLQLGGQNVLSNLWPLNSSVNRSLGAQIALQIRGLSIGTVIRSVTIIDEWLI